MSTLKSLAVALVLIGTVAQAAHAESLPLTHEVITPGQPRRDARRYAVFVWASTGIYADQCMSKNDPMRIRSLERFTKNSSLFSDEERRQASEEALAEFNRLGSYEFCRINYRAMGRPAL
jgi:hypothetical protein